MKDQSKTKAQLIAELEASHENAERLARDVEQRNAELAIVNSISAAMAQRLDLQGIIRVVGDKVRDIFSAEITEILLLDEATNLIHMPYSYYRGYQTFEPFPLGEGLTSLVIRTRMPVTHGTLEEGAAKGALFFSEEDKTESYIGVPIISGDKVLGVLSVQSYRPHAFDESNVRLLSTLANAMSVALENARLFDETQRLLKETEQRNAELAIINSVQEGLASKLEMQAIYDLVGDKIRNIFDAEVVNIVTYEHATDLLTERYSFEKGDRTQLPEPVPSYGFRKHVIKTRQPLVINHDVERLSVEFGNRVLYGEPSKSNIFVPMIVGNEVTGILSLQNVDRENAFTDSDVSLLQTLANSMSVALENARLFDETQRLFQAEQQRAAELAIINSVQQALASRLELQAVYELVGEKIREIFNAEVVYIAVCSAEDANRIEFPYYLDRDHLLTIESRSLGVGLTSRVILGRQLLYLPTQEDQIALGALFMQGEVSQSYLGVPITMGADVLGVLSVQSYQRNAYAENDFRLLTTLANSLGVALNNARLFDETQRLFQAAQQRAAELAIINRISQALASELEPDALIQLVGERLRETFNADIVYVALLDRATNLIHFPYGFGTEDFASFPFGQGLTSKIIESGQPLLINRDIDARAEEIGAARRGAEAKSYLGVPIMVGKQAIGVVSVQSTQQEGRFGESDLRLLTTISANVGTAIQNARLFDETQRRADEMAALTEIGRDISSTLDFNTVLEMIAARAYELLKARDVVLRLVESDGNMPAVVARGKYADVFRKRTVRLGQGLTGSIARTGIAEVVNDPLNDSRIARVPETGKDEATEALLFAPLHTGEKVIGILAVWRDKIVCGPFTQSDLNFAIGLARQAAIAIANARLFETERKAREEAETLRAVTQALGSTLSLTEVIDVILGELQKVVPYDSCSLQERRGDRLVIIGGRGFNDIQSLLGVSFDLDDETNPGTKVVRTRQPTVIGDVSLHPQFQSETHGAGKIRGWIGVPLVFGERVIGMMSLDKYQAGFYTLEHVRLAQAFAAQAATALENARLFETERAAHAQAETLRAASQALSRTLSLREVFDLILTEMQKVVPYDSCSVQQLDGNEMVIVGGRGFPNLDELLGVRFDWRNPDDPAGRVVSAREPVILPDASAGFEHFRDQEHGAGRVHGWMGVPLLFGERLIGMITLDKFEMDFYTPEHARLALAFASQAAAAIENARLFQDAQDARAAAEQANQSKSTFLANMSHELRTPLNAITGFTRIVKRKAEGVLPDKQVENLDKVLSSAEHLLGLINTILDIAKIEAGRMDVQPAPFNVAHLIEMCAATVQPLLKPRVELVKQVEPGLALVYSDQDKVKQILLNLLSNAAKFTHEGSIILDARTVGNRLAIDVTDTGIGIPEDAQVKVFEEFQQADSSTTRKYGGTGLGLSISRHLARLLGGDITLRSKEGEGSTFTFTLPLRYGDQAATSAQSLHSPEAPPQLQAAPSGKPIVLAIDDDPDVIYLLREDLSQAGYQVAGATSAAEAVQKAKELHPFAITLDIVMPQKDGWQVLHELKHDPETQAIPVILLTIVDKKPLGYQLGAADYLVKPFNTDAVLAVLKGLTHANGGISPRRLLVVDDDPNVLDLVRQLLNDSHYEIETALDGVSALESVECQRPDAILLDLMLPRLDGFGVIEQLRSDPAHRTIPIVVITAKTLTAEEAARVHAGVSAVIQKQGLDAGSLIRDIEHAMQTQPLS